MSADPTSTVGEALVAELRADHRWRRCYDDAPPQRRAAMRQALVALKHRIVGPLLPDSPSAEIAARLVLGEHPTDLVVGLTAAEAADYCTQSTHRNPVEWVWSRVVGEHPELADVTSPNYIAVVRWVAAVMADQQRRASLLRDREISFRLRVAGPISRRLEEIRPVDLRSSVSATIEACEVRTIAEEWDGPDELREPEPWHERVPPGCRVLIHYSTLRAEGIEQCHCASAYAKEIAAGKSVVVAVDHGGERSTIEIRGGRLKQHAGRANSSPPESHDNIALEVLYAYHRRKDDDR